MHCNMGIQCKTCTQQHLNLAISPSNMHVDPFHPPHSCSACLFNHPWFELWRVVNLSKWHDDHMLVVV